MSRIPQVGRRGIVLLIAAIILVGIVPGVAAAEQRTGGSVTVGENETVSEDLTAVGGSVSIRGTVEGDVQTIAGSVVIEDGAEVTGDVAATVAEILGLHNNVETAAFTQSSGASGSALRWGMSVPEGPTLVIAADTPRGEPDDAVDHAAGAGAVAFLVADDGLVEIEATATYTEEFPGTRFREHGAVAIDTYDATAYEREAYETVVTGAVEALSESPTAIAPTAPNGKLPYRVARQHDDDIDVYQNASDLGDTGAASAFFGLLSAWADDRDEVTVVAYGDGSSAVAVHVAGTLDVTWDRETVDISYAEYARKRGHIVATRGDD